MFKNYVKSLTIVGLVLFMIVSEVQSGVIIDGIKKAIANTRCHLHGTTNSIHHHEHGSDPCDVKRNQVGPSQQEISRNRNNEASSTVRSLILHGGSQTNKNASTNNADSRRLINTGANCPEGHRADAKGNCYLIY
ncbi:uncharacterized protein LOC108912273 [Anoplophora glabripennis]|uniref:uncharacterized protein LOC108912273 n=1 Tax=Anoplophora glabripennis TaxID=217634 RepID=UPI0008747279|nr:uncharacterized protein LOC108912273 [Anoplophora glabripennis]